MKMCQRGLDNVEAADMMTTILVHEEMYNSRFNFKDIDVVTFDDNRIGGFMLANKIIGVNNALCFEEKRVVIRNLTGSTSM